MSAKDKFVYIIIMLSKSPVILQALAQFVYKVCHFIIVVTVAFLVLLSLKLLLLLLYVQWME